MDLYGAFGILFCLVALYADLKMKQMVDKAKRLSLEVFKDLDTKMNAEQLISAIQENTMNMVLNAIRSAPEKQDRGNLIPHEMTDSELSEAITKGKN